MKVLTLTILKATDPFEPILELDYSWTSVLFAVVAYTVSMAVSAGILASVGLGLLCLLAFPLFEKAWFTGWLSVALAVLFSFALVKAVYTGDYFSAVLCGFCVACDIWSSYNIFKNKSNDKPDNQS